MNLFDMQVDFGLERHFSGERTVWSAQPPLLALQSFGLGLDIPRAGNDPLVHNALSPPFPLPVPLLPAR